MRAWRVHQLGSAVLDDDVADLGLDPDDPHAVIVRVEAAAANYADSLVIDGIYQERPPLPFTPGLEVAGVVTATNSDRFAEGDRVVGLTTAGAGSWGRYARCDARQLAALPVDVDAVAAIGIHVNAQTAWFALHRRGGVQSGETVLVHAAAGGVGTMAVQLALAAGCTVIATASAGKLELPRSLGAHHCLDNRAPDWAERVRQLTDGAGVDVVVDPVGGAVFSDSWRLLRFEGRLVTVGFTSGEVPSVRANHALVKNVTLHGLYWARYTFEAPDVVDAAAAEVFELHRDGRLDPCVTVVSPMDEALQRVHEVAAGATTGKSVLTWDEQVS